MLIRQGKPFGYGYTAIISMDEKESNALMDFGILRLGKNQVELNSEEKERAFLLIQGEVSFEWEGKRVMAKRQSFLENEPWCLSIPAGVKVKITGIGEDSELSVSKTDNENKFASKLYSDTECRSEIRGKGTMNETSTRTVRTVFDYSNAPYSKLVIGEVISYPGKWSSYPPHYHTQPEIYFYKFYPEQGYGLSELGEDVIKVRNNDTVKILDGITHPQVSAPGFAMYLIWVIRHLDGEPYIKPTFIPEYLWVTEPDARIWPDR